MAIDPQLLESSRVEKLEFGFEVHSIDSFFSTIRYEKFKELKEIYTKPRFLAMYSHLSKIRHLIEVGIFQEEGGWFKNEKSFYLIIKRLDLSIPATENREIKEYTVFSSFLTLQQAIDFAVSNLKGQGLCYDEETREWKIEGE